MEKSINRIDCFILAAGMSKRMGNENKLLKKINNNTILNQTLINHIESKINNIKVGNIEDNFDLVKKADWIVEAVVERIDIKHKLYEKISKVKKCKFFLATGKDYEEQIILKEILDSDFKNLCVPLDNFSIKETLPIIKSCNISICNDSSFSHLSAAVGTKTITLMADTPLIYGNYCSKMFPIIPEGEKTVSHNTLGKEKISPQKIFDKIIEIIN